jgi:hypothetical protein
MSVAGTLNIDMTAGHLYDLTSPHITKKFLVEDGNGERVIEQLLLLFC